jgi:alpha-tubulin suppressor-like RCC1 family protein
MKKVLFSILVIALALNLIACKPVLSGKLSAWGSNEQGQLGNSTIADSITPVIVSDFSEVIAVSGGGYFSLALKSDGTIWSWGENAYGQLGRGMSDPVRFSNIPLQVSGLNEVKSIAAGCWHCLALKSNGTVWAWGQGYNSVPVQVSGLSGVSAISAGFAHDLVLKTDGTVWGWGSNGYGQLGNDTTTNSITPVHVNDLSGIREIAAGWGHSLALKSDGTVWSWGINIDRELGNDSIAFDSISCNPVKVNGLIGVKAIAAGTEHSLALKSDGTVCAWGGNQDNQLGDAGANNHSSTPVRVTGLSKVIAIAAGNYHNLALKFDGTVWAWGRNASGQLGNGTSASSGIPVQVSGLSRVFAITAGGFHSLALASEP